MSTKTYKPRMRRKKIEGINEKNKFVTMPNYFQSVMWKDLHAKLENANALVFINIYNGEVNHVTIKEIRPGGHTEIKSKGKKQAEDPVESIPQETSTNNKNGKKENPERSNTIEASSGNEEEEIPEEGEAELPPEEPEVIPPKKEKQNGEVVQEQEQKQERKNEEGQTLEEGHRVLAKYKGKEVRGEVKKIIEDVAQTEIILLLDGGEKVIVGAEDLISIIVSARAK